MKSHQTSALVILALFYTAYFTKMILQAKKGVKTDQMAKGSKPRKVLIIEMLLKMATYSIVPVELYSIIYDIRLWKSLSVWLGILIAVLGLMVFVIAMVTMRDNWRAGIPEKDQTALVTTGIYRLSRNPAFLGFDLVYLGILISFSNYLLLLFTLLVIVMLHLQILQEETFLTNTFGESYSDYKKRTGRYFVIDKTYEKKTKRIIRFSILLCVILGLGGLMIYGNSQMQKLPQLTFSEALAYTTKNNPDAVITVGIIKDGQVSYQVYGEDGRELPDTLHTYEIGSLTKTFTAALINKAISEGRVSLESTIDNYLQLPNGNQYPTIKELLTHTSGYRGYYFETPMIGNSMIGRNDFYGITKEMVIDRMGQLSLSQESYDFTYSNYGYAVLGLVLEAVYDTDYSTLVNNFAQNDLGLTNTKISDRSGDLDNYWDWKSDDAYLSAGAITSDISDMLSYAKMQLDGDPYFADCHQTLASINAYNASYESMGIHMDEIGMAWILDTENGIIWHNGGTGDYNSYLGFHPETGTAVVILSNLPPSYRIPATVLGVKLMGEIR